MSGNPLVTVITPSYNHAKYLDDYFRGLLAQTYKNIELIICDDASTDGSWEKICDYRERLQAELAHVILQRHERNLGLIATMGELKSQIHGGFVCILESDDYYKPEMIAECVNYLKANPDEGAVHGDVDFLYADHIQSNRWGSSDREIARGEIFEALLWENFILSCAFCCRSNLYIKHADYARYAKQGYVTVDYPMFLDLARHTKFGYIDKSLAVYRVVKNSISHPDDLQKRFLWKKAYYQTKLDYIEKYGASKDVVERAERQYHKNLHDYGYEAFCREEFEQGYRWLRTHFSEEYGGLRSRARAFGMKHKSLWKILKWLDNSRIRKA